MLDIPIVSRVANVGELDWWVDRGRHGWVGVTGERDTVKSSRPDYGAASISSLAINKVVSESNEILEKDNEREKTELQI